MYIYFFPAQNNLVAVAVAVEPPPLFIEEELAAVAEELAEAVREELAEAALREEYRHIIEREQRHIRSKTQLRHAVIWMRDRIMLLESLLLPKLPTETSRKAGRWSQDDDNRVLYQLIPLSTCHLISEEQPEECRSRKKVNKVRFFR